MTIYKYFFLEIFTKILVREQLSLLAAQINNPPTQMNNTAYDE